MREWAARPNTGCPFSLRPWLEVCARLKSHPRAQQLPINRSIYVTMHFNPAELPMSERRSQARRSIPPGVDAIPFRRAQCDWHPKDFGPSGPCAPRLDECARCSVAILVSNGVKYSPLGKRIFIGVKMTDARLVRIEVRDEGPSLSADDQKKLFGKFARHRARFIHRQKNARIDEGQSLVRIRTRARRHLRADTARPCPVIELGGLCVGAAVFRSRLTRGLPSVSSPVLCC
jgi:hypothetical protein